MTVTITLTDPTADESRAVRAYLDALHGGTGERDVPYVQMTGRGDRTPLKIDTSSVDLTEGFDLPNTPEPTSAEDAGAPDFDSAGLPWDERIHASSRATVADGTWRKKRGVSPEEVERVESELARERIKEMDSANEAIAEATGTTDAQTVGAPEAPPSPKDDVDNADYSEGQITEPTVEADAPPPPPAATSNPFLAVMSRIGKSKLDKAKKDELLTAAGALDDKGNPSILVLNKRPELIDGFVALLDSEGV